MFCVSSTVISDSFPVDDNDGYNYNDIPEVMPDTKPLTWDCDISAKMMDGAHKFVEAKIKESVINRSKLWNRDFSSPEAYETSVEPNRSRFKKYIGVEDKNEPLTR